MYTAQRLMIIQISRPIFHGSFRSSNNPVTLPKRSLSGMWIYWSCFQPAYSSMEFLTTGAILEGSDTPVITSDPLRKETNDPNDEQ